MTPGARGGTAVPFAAPLRFLLMGVLALAGFWTALALTPTLAAAPFVAPGVLALVHALTLGFATSILVGALHQLMPVLLATPLYAPGWAGVTVALSTAGAAGIVGAFALGGVPSLLAAGGVLVWGAVAVFAGNLLRTAMRARRWDAPAVTMLVAVAFLLLTVTLGLGLAMARLEPAVARALGPVTPLHAGLGLVGAFGLAIAGAGHRLLGMFTVAHGAGTAALRGAAVATIGGTVLLAGIAWVPGASAHVGWLAPLARAAFVAAAALAGFDLWGVFRTRVRRRPDVGVVTFLAGLAGWALAAGALAVGRPVEAVTLVLVLGLPLAVAGMLAKIVAFLTWQHRYAHQIGKGAPPPLVAELQVPALAWFTFLGLGLGGLGVAMTRAFGWAEVAPVASAIGAVGAWSLVAHVAWIAFAPHRSRKAASRGGSPRKEVAHAQ